MRYLTFPLVALLIVACAGGTLTPKCGEAETYCSWDLASGERQELCCPFVYRYCGIRGKRCPEGYCCSADPKNEAP